MAIQIHFGSRPPLMHQEKVEVTVESWSNYHETCSNSTQSYKKSRIKTEKKCWVRVFLMLKALLLHTASSHPKGETGNQILVASGARSVTMRTSMRLRYPPSFLCSYVQYIKAIQKLRFIRATCRQCECAKYRPRKPCFLNNPTDCIYISHFILKYSPKDVFLWKCATRCQSE